MHWSVRAAAHSRSLFLRKVTHPHGHHRWFRRRTVQDSRAKAFAFILYNFNDVETREILKNQGGFTRLDRLSGRDLSIFYLNSDNRRSIRVFNDFFLNAFDVSSNRNLPFVLFFKLADREAKDVEIVELEQSNIMFAFEELYGVIEEYIRGLNSVDTNKGSRPNKFIRVYKSVKKIATEKFIEYLITKSLEYGGRYL